MGGQLVFNVTALVLDAALASLELAYLLEDLVQTYVDEGRLVRMLGDWFPPFPEAITSTNRAVGNPRPPSPCSSLHGDIAIVIPIVQERT